MTCQSRTECPVRSTLTPSGRPRPECLCSETIRDRAHLRKLGLLHIVDVDTCIRMIRDYAAETPLTHYYSWTLPPGLPASWVQLHLELFASQVIPGVRAIALTGAAHIPSAGVCPGRFPHKRRGRPLAALFSRPQQVQADQEYGRQGVHYGEVRGGGQPKHILDAGRREGIGVDQADQR